MSSSGYARWTLSPRIVYAVPELLAPGDENLHVLLDGPAALPYAHGIDLDGDLLGTKTPDGCTDTSLEECHAVPGHVEFNGLGEDRVASARREDCQRRRSHGSRMAHDLQ